MIRSLWRTLRTWVTSSATFGKFVPYRQGQSGGVGSLLIQAGRDVHVGSGKTPPQIKLAKLSISDVNVEAGLQQRINAILKNNGDTSAFLLKGKIVVEDAVEMTDCSGTMYHLSEADWTYNVALDTDDPYFEGRHYLAPNEIINFDIMVGRKHGGNELTIYRCHLELEFDEGGPFRTSAFFLRLTGPMIPLGSFSPGQTPEAWGLCMAENIRRLDQIGYNFRPYIHRSSKKHIKAVAPDIFED